MDTIEIETRLLYALQQRAEAMTQGDMSALGQPLSDIPAVEDVRRAIDVLGSHTEEGLRMQHAHFAALSTAQEAERSRLARELHDEVVQQLIALGHGIDRAQRLLERDTAQASERLAQVRSSVTALVGELRGLIGDLRPPALDELGLLPAVRQLLKTKASGAPAVEIAVEGGERRLAPASELAVFRIIQESWNNMRRHAQASQASFRFAFGQQSLHIRIHDNGTGFATSESETATDGHWGLRGMRERAELAGGTLVLHSAPGAGTEIMLDVPYPGVDNRDPVCGMAAGPEALGAEHAGKLYRFCSAACRELFQAQPEQYVSRASGVD